MRAFTMLLLYALVVPASGIAQATARPGDRVRVTFVAPEGRTRIIGTLDSIARDSVYMHMEGSGPLTFGLRYAARFERSLTGKRRASISGAVSAGVVVGALVGAGLGAFTAGEMDPGAAALILGAVFTVPGALVGGIVGSIAREQWEVVSPAIQ